MPPNPLGSADDTSSLEQLRQKLYHLEKEVESADVPGVVSATAPEHLGWEPTVVPQKKEPMKLKRKMSIATLFLIIAGVFFVIAVAGAAAFLILGSRSVSTDRVIITSDGPSAIASGDRVSLLIDIENQNPVPVHSTLLSVELPETARDGEDPTKPIEPHWSDTLGDIVAGASGQKTIDVIFSGAEGDRIRVPIRFEYRVEGSNAVFVKESSYEVVITSSPLSVRAETVNEAQAGQSLTFAVTVRSNAKTPMDDVAVTLNPIPFGFTLKTGQKTLIPVGALLPGEEKTVTLTGTLSAEDAEQRVFHFVAGTIVEEAATVLAISYAKTDAVVSLAKPFIATTLSINRDAGESPVISAEAPAQGIISWVNTLPGPVFDGQVAVKLSGNAVDPYSVSTNDGFYRSSDATVIYSKENLPGLSRLDPGGSGTGSFTFRSKSAQSLIGVSQPQIVATISIAGRRSGQSNVPEGISGTVVRTIKIGTDLALATRAVRTVGPFKNTGPWPPVADQESTYTILLSLTNTVNSVGDAAVTAVLPSYMRYVGTMSPDDGSVTYNAGTRTITWNAGDVPVGAGYNATPAKTMAVQVALLPSVSQRGTSPILLFSQNVTGVDRFTKKALAATHEEVTAQTLTDPAHQPGFGEVR